MKLQKQRTRQVKGKEYYRWVIVIPTKDIEELDWKDGDELTSKANKDKQRLIVERTQK